MRKHNSSGFTLMEMLIVVAIIAILVAIAIPTFNNALEKSREATDTANLRAAYAQVIADGMLENAAPAKTEYIEYTYSDDSYSAEVTSTKKQDDWVGDSVVVGGSAISAKCNGAKWTITYDASDGTVTFG